MYWDQAQDAGYINKIPGYTDGIQGPMEVECQLVRNGLYCGNDWRLLLPIDRDDVGDFVRIYFWIGEQDLVGRNFETAGAFYSAFEAWVHFLKKILVI
ncbi:DUF1963 domain-containing protein [Chitinophaga agri]|uniref:DUF1963 domain-containing protein n=1 Tax=Chitinophaga agri TaxID=2703787 RepID=A0A6B9ZAR8_9BACT|nr:DUF1963 domain-containing protein [Chitinophaga agri]